MILGSLGYNVRHVGAATKIDWSDISIRSFAAEILDGITLIEQV